MKVVTWEYCVLGVLIYTLGYTWAISPHNDTKLMWMIHWASMAAIIFCMLYVVLELAVPVP
jgi:uncharacterized membrane protein YjfL (UPF0719 family)